MTAGVLLALSFPRAGIAGAAWIAPALMLLAARHGKAFWNGYLAGFAHGLLSLIWLLEIPVHFYPILGWIALAAYVGAFIATWVWLCSRFTGDRRPATWIGRTAVALLCAAMWVGIEMIQARLFSGFPWNLLASSQYRLLPLIQISSVTGMYGVAFLVVFFSVSLLHSFDAAMRFPSDRHRWLSELAVPIFLVAVVYAIGLGRISHRVTPDKTLKVALIQPSIPQEMIWNAAEADKRFEELLRLSSAALTNQPDLMIWPEAAVPGYVRYDEEIQRAITGLARANHCWIIVGSDDIDSKGTNRIYFNSSFLISPSGELISTYRKRRLVIFGEYVPLVDWFPFIKYLTPITGGFAAGEKPVVFQLGPNGARMSVLICFEDTFPHYAREHVSEGLDFLVNITNDGWFGESSAQWQQAATAVFRAVENRVPLVRCSNNGITCWVDAYGAMHEVGFDSPTDVYRAGFKVVDVPLKSGTPEQPTIYTRVGDWFGWTCVAITCVPVIGRWLERRRSRLAQK